MRFFDPILSRPDFWLFRCLSAPGLGNLLFPFYRAAVLAEKSGGTLIWPPWYQLKMKTLFNEGRLRRNYGNIFLRPSNVVPTISGRLNAILHPNCSEQMAWEGNLPKTARVLVEGVGDHYQRLIPYTGLVQKLFRKMNANNGNDKVFGDIENGCVMHIRLGDFLPFVGGETLLDSRSMPPEYYKEALDIAVEKYGVKKIIIISDGSSDELIKKGYEFPRHDVTLRLDGTPQSDLLLLTMARVRIASASTFSMWASFLSSGPTLRPKNGVWFETGNMNEHIV